MDWKVTYLKKGLKFNKLTLIEGLPGLGNVGKIVADTIVDEVNAEKIVDIFSYYMPNSVFVNEHNLVDLPKIEIYYKKINKKDYLFLVGDVQPMDEYASYTFTETILDIVQKYGCQHIVTLGGIGIHDAPEKPKVYCTGNDTKFTESFKPFRANPKLYGVVGPIMGVSGLLLGLSTRRKIKAASLLAETFGHPLYVGVKGAKEMLKVLNKRFDMQLSMKGINKEIRKIDKEVNPDISGKQQAYQVKNYKEMSYIG